MATDTMTSISVHSSTLKMLQSFKKGDMTWDDVLVDFIEEHVPKEFVREMVRRSEEDSGIPWEDVERRRKRGR